MTYDLYARRPFFSEDHEAFRTSVRSFLARDVTGHVEDWERHGDIPRSVWDSAGELGLFGLAAPEHLGGGGEPDYRFRMAAIEEFTRVGAASPAATIATHADILLHYVVDLATPEQAERWVPRLASGEWIGAIAMTEPGAGSDLRAIATTADRDGDGWVLNGTKTFISNGIHSQLVVVAARTGRAPDAPLSLFVVEDGASGFGRGKKLEKLGLKAQDTAELSFEDVRIPASHLLGEEGRGMRAIVSHLPLERLSIAANAVAGMRAALAWTIEYVLERRAFGKALAEFQNTQFTIAELVTELEATQAFVDEMVLRHNRGELTPVDAAKVKWWATESHKRAVDRCLQLFGGYGFMSEYPIARAYADTRVTTIFGGTTEIMKTIIARDVLGVR
ncbi:long-chain-acyl-CoA dehydrogenase [Microbacterium resistens]|uniref:Long-chain-acyl-CoA dehydrogenase n=1 Tax=Microbacterium resistens TaxID=156977 RepID=A0ABU1SFL9_9MICO|nr:acyl-CoA dehydrogenase family protein [Microbacterium resistens]MDR6868354.1 long-chain-acyl-CoA dehydrogenase [Microbacterium resistens]